MIDALRVAIRDAMSPDGLAIAGPFSLHVPAGGFRIALPPGVRVSGPLGIARAVTAIDVGADAIEIVIDRFPDIPIPLKGDE